MRIENEELARKEMKTQVMTFEGERNENGATTTSSNKLINTTTENDERNSVCSKVKNFMEILIIISFIGFRL